jgi:hypothetical protein
MIKDIEHIFELFKIKKKVPTKNETLNEHIFNLKMYSKLIIKGHVRPELIISYVKQIDPNLSRELILSKSYAMLYDRALLYVSEININDKLCLKAIKKCTDVFLVTALQMSIKYYEDTEEYEKCAVLYKILKECLKIFGEAKKAY